MPDTGLAMTRHFREWLRARYGTDAALQAAWAMPDVTLDTAKVPGVTPRLDAAALGMRDPVHQRWVMDYYLCQQAITADGVEDFCRTASRATGGRTFAGAFYGYYQGVYHQNQGGHLEMGRLLQSPDISYLAAPYDYSNRLMGNDGRLRALPEAFPLAGKVHMIESDLRTHLHPVDEYGRQSDADQSVAAIRREFSTALTQAAALWWCDFGEDGGGGWYDHPRLIGAVKDLMGLAGRRLDQPRKPVAQVAVICDPPSNMLLSDGEGMGAHNWLIEYVTRELYHTGAPFDTFLLSELPAADLSRYKLIIFLDTLTMDPATREAVQAATRGRTVLWMWAPGISDGQQLSPDLVRDVTGFSVGLQGQGLAVGNLRCDAADPLVTGLPATDDVRFEAASSTPVPEALDASAWFNPRDEKTMAETYKAFDWAVADEAMRWHFRTREGWTDIHLDAGFPDAQGLSMTVQGAGGSLNASVCVAVKDANDDEFVTPDLALTGLPQKLTFAFQSLPKASWRPQQPDRITLPVKGLKVVVRGVSDTDSALTISDLMSVEGEVNVTQHPGFSNPGGIRQCLDIRDPAALTLGTDPATGAVILAARGQAPSRQVLCTMPYLPREVLAPLMDEAGVNRYIASPYVIVRADSNLIALHTANGGHFTLRLPSAMKVTDAVTGAPVGEGTSMALDLSPNSTMLLSTAPLQ
jgi:hypothetical protein